MNSPVWPQDGQGMGRLLILDIIYEVLLSGNKGPHIQSEMQKTASLAGIMYPRVAGVFLHPETNKS